MKLINLQTGQLEEHTPDQTAINLANGTHVPTENKGVLFNSSGQLVFVPDYQIGEAVTKYGYQIPEPNQLLQYGEKYKYSTPEASLKAFAAGAGRGASFGLTDLLATKSGLVAPETLRKLQEYLPEETGLGEVAGVIGTSFIPGSPVAKIASGAKKVETATRAALAARLPANVMAKKIASLAAETGVKGLGGSIEGLAYGLGQTVSEASLGDEELTAQKLIANATQSAILGGALSAAMVPGKLALQKSVEKAKSAYTKLKEFAIGKYEPIAGAVSKAEVEGVENAIGEGLFDPNVTPKVEQFKPGVITGFIAKGKALVSGKETNEILEGLQRTEGQQYITQKDLNLKSKELRESVNDIYQSTQKALSKVTGVVRPQEIENLLVGTPIAPAKATFDNFIRQGLDVIASMQSEEYLYNKAIYKTFEKKLLGLAQQAGYTFEKNEQGFIEIVQEGNKFKNTADYFKQLNSLKQYADELSGYDAKTPKADRLKEVANTQDKMIEFGGAVRKSLEDPEIFGAAAARQQGINAAITEYRRATDKGSFFSTKFLTGPDKERRVDGTKTKQFMRFINDDRGEFGRTGLARFLNASERLIQQLDETVKNVPTESIDTEALKAFVKASAIKANQAKSYVQEFDGGLGYMTDVLERAMSGNIGSAVGTVVKAIADPTTATTALSQIEKLSSRVTKKINEKSSTLFEKLRPLPKASLILKDESPEERKKRYEESTKKLNEMSSNPAELINKLEKATENTFSTAPKISQALQFTTIQALSFLNSKIPKPVHKSPLDREYEPSQAQMIKFLRYQDAVENPLVVLDELESNNVLPETMETIQTIYPKLYLDIQSSIMGKLVDKMNEDSFKLPYQRRIVLSRFLDMNLDSTMLPEIINRNQEVLTKLAGEAEQEEQAREEAMRTSQSGADKLSLASRNQTALTQTMSRA